MAALSADTIHKTRPRGRGAYFVTNSTTIYAGSLVGVDASGHLQPWADTANFEFIGVALEGVATTASTTAECRVDTSGTILREVTVASSDQTSVGELVESPTDNPEDMTLTAPANVGYIGRVIRFHSGDSCDVELFTPAEHLIS